MSNPYVELTAEFNRKGLCCLLSSGQAVVVHGLAVVSKDGDWIVREDPGALSEVLRVLEDHGARYRFGAPLDTRWLAGGWSSHFEFARGSVRLRCDFVSRPPRVSPATLAKMWAEAEASGDPVVGFAPLAALKLTNRERDYAIVGEIARRMTDPEDQFAFSRSARDLLALATRFPAFVATAQANRPALAAIPLGTAALEAALDRERRELMRANELRLQRYMAACAAWEAGWVELNRDLTGLPLAKAHMRFVERAKGVLPYAPPEASA